MTTKKLLTAVSLLCLSLAIGFAQGPNGSEKYYQAANGKSGAALKTALHNIIKSHTQINYKTGLIEAYENTDTRADGYVRDWYSKTTNYTHDVDKAGSYSKEGDCYNREHSVPASWFSNAYPMYSDIVHVVPTDGYVNNRRSNYPFGETNGETYKSNNGYCKLGKCTVSGYTGDVFEPGDDVKGDFARIYFYMVTCYEDKIASWVNNATADDVFDGKTYPGLKSWYLNLMFKWSKQDPIDAVEIARNNAVKEEQGNRNPFVDYPGLEDYIWGDKKTDAFSYDKYDGSSTGKQFVTMSFSPASVSVVLGDDFTAPTLTTSPSGLTVTYSSSNTSVATVNASTGAVTIKAVGTTTITASFAGNDDYYANSASYTLTVTKQGGGDEPTPSGETLLWESFSGYNGTTDTSSAITPSDENLDYDGWASLTKVFLGANGTGKLSSGSGNGSMVTKTIALTGNGVLTFKLKKYGSDTSSLSLSVSGATADVARITAEADWVDYVVNISDANGSITLTFNATKRLYIDDIKLVAAGQSPAPLLGDVNGDGEVTIADVTALVNILLGKDTAGYNLKAADVNSDGGRTIADVVALVKMILTK